MLTHTFTQEGLKPKQIQIKKIEGCNHREQINKINSTMSLHHIMFWLRIKTITSTVDHMIHRKN